MVIPVGQSTLASVELLQPKMYVVATALAPWTLATISWGIAVAPASKTLTEVVPGANEVGNAVTLAEPEMPMRPF